MARNFSRSAAFRQFYAGFIYLINTNILYIFDTQELREWVLEHQHNLKLVDMGDFALGYIIRLNDLKDISIKIKL